MQSHIQHFSMSVAYLNSNCYCFLAIDGGIPLDQILQQWLSFEENMMNKQQKTLRNMSLPSIQVIQFFMSDSASAREEALSFKGDLMDMVSVIENANITGRKTVASQIQAHCIDIAYTFGDYDRASKLLDVFDNLCCLNLIRPCEELYPNLFQYSGGLLLTSWLHVLVSGECFS